LTLAVVGAGELGGGHAHELGGADGGFVDEALLELALRFQTTFINENFGFDLLLEVVGENDSLAG
jgi:hypothetical protein